MQKRIGKPRNDLFGTKVDRIDEIPSPDMVVWSQNVQDRISKSLFCHKTCKINLVSGDNVVWSKLCKNDSLSLIMVA